MFFSTPAVPSAPKYGGVPLVAMNVVYPQLAQQQQMQPQLQQLPQQQVLMQSPPPPPSLSYAYSLPDVHTVATTSCNTYPQSPHSFSHGNSTTSYPGGSTSSYVNNHNNANSNNNTNNGSAGGLNTGTINASHSIHASVPSSNNSLVFGAKEHKRRFDSCLGSDAPPGHVASSGWGANMTSPMTSAASSMTTPPIYVVVQQPFLPSPANQQQLPHLQQQQHYQHHQQHFCLSQMPFPPSSSFTGIPGVFSPSPIFAASRCSAQENGSKYELGEWYEGYVKRYNPMRGFGFLTATHHLRVISPPTYHSTKHVMSTQTSTSAAAAANEKDAAGMSTSATGEMKATAEGEKGADVKNEVAAELQARVERTPVSLGDIFVHQSYIQMQGFRALSIGDKVVFRIGVLHGRKAHQAVSVQPVGEQENKVATSEEGTSTFTTGYVDKGEKCVEKKKQGESEKEGEKGKRKEEEEEQKKVENERKKMAAGRRFSSDGGRPVEQDIGGSLNMTNENIRNMSTQDSPNIIESYPMIGECATGFDLREITFSNEDGFFHSAPTADVQDVSRHVNEQIVLPDVDELCDILGSLREGQ